MIIARSRIVENADWTAISTALDAQASPGHLLVYSGVRKARGVAVDSSNTLILDIVLQKPCAASIANGTLTFNSVQPAQVLANVAHSWARGVDGSGNWVFDMDTGILNTPLSDGSLAAFQFDAASWAAGSYLWLTSLALKFPD